MFSTQKNRSRNQITSHGETLFVHLYLNFKDKNVLYLLPLEFKTHRFSTFGPVTDQHAIKRTEVGCAYFKVDNSVSLLNLLHWPCIKSRISAEPVQQAMMAMPRSSSSSSIYTTTDLNNLLSVMLLSCRLMSFVCDTT